MASRLRLPFLIAEAIGVYVTFTPPNSGAEPDEIAPTGFREDFLNTLTRYSVVFTRGIFVLAELAEIGVILPSVLPPPLSNHLSAALSSLGRPQRLRVTPLFVFGTLAASAAGLIRYTCYRTLGRLFTFQLGIRKEHQLVTAGPYSIVRHPSYTALAFAIVGAVCSHAAPGSWLRESNVLRTPIGKGLTIGWIGMMAAVSVALFMRIPDEDRLLQKRFGKEWDEWARRVRYRVIPGVY